MRKHLLLATLLLLFASTLPAAENDLMPADRMGRCFVHDHNVILNWGNILIGMFPEDFAGEIPADFNATCVVMRNGEVIAELPPTERSYVDRDVPEGKYEYLVTADVGNAIMLLLECTVVVKPYTSPQDLKCEVICAIPADDAVPANVLEELAGKGDGNGDPNQLHWNGFCNVLLTWSNPVNYLAVLIVRDNHLVKLLPGSSEAWTDSHVSAGTHTYQVYGIIPGILPAATETTIDQFLEINSDEAEAEAIAQIRPVVIRLSDPAVCRVKVPDTSPPGPYDLTCIVIEIDSWNQIPELSVVAADKLPALPFKGVLLIWKNRTFYEKITISRDGEVIDSLPGNTWYYLDPNVPAGDHVYKVWALDEGIVTRPAACKVAVPGPEIPPPPADLTCRVLCPIDGIETDIATLNDDAACVNCLYSCLVAMKWRNSCRYDGITITLDGDAYWRLSGEETSFVDRDPPAGGHTYGVIGVRAGQASEETLCKVYVPAPPPVLPPRNLACTVEEASDTPDNEPVHNVVMTWKNPQNYEWIVIRKNGEHLARVPGITTQYTDTDVADGSYVYAVSGMVEEQIGPPALCRVVVPKPPLKPPYDLVCTTNLGLEPIEIPDTICLPGMDVVENADGEIPVMPLNAVFLRWRNGSRYDTILIHRDKELIDKIPGTRIHYIDTDVSPGVHVYHVTGVRGDEKTESAECKVEIAGPVPPPENLTCELLTDASDPTTEEDITGPAVLLKWENPAEYSGIMIFRNKCLIAKLEGTETSYLDKGLLPGAYVYSVVGVLDHGQSIPTICKIEVTGPVPPPQRLTCESLPIDCLSEDGSSSDCIGAVVKLAWYNPVRYEKIVIMREGEEIAQLAGERTYYYDKEVEPGGTYTYAVIGIMRSGEESEAAECEVSIPPEPLKPPYDLVCETSDQTVKLSWTNGAAYAAILISRDNASLVELEGEAETYVDENVPVGRHVYLVSGVDEAGTQSSPARCRVYVQGTVLRNVLHFGRNISTDVLPPADGTATCYENNKDPIEAWSFGVCNDPAEMAPEDATIEDTFVQTLNGGEGPGFFVVDITNSGVTMAAIVQDYSQGGTGDTAGQTGIEPGENRSLLRITYTQTADSTRTGIVDGDIYRINYCSQLGDPAVSVLYVVDGYETRPDTVSGVVRFPSQQPVEFIRGDANEDSAVDISDVVRILNYLFGGGATPTCMAANDANGSGSVNIADPVFILNYLFLSGDAPPAPFPDCGLPENETAGALSCESFSGCN